MNEIIEELARQYAEDMCPEEDYRNGALNFDEERNNDMAIYIDDAKCVLDWLFKKNFRLASDRCGERDSEM